MNTESILNLNQRIESLASDIKDIQKIISALKINDQKRLDANNPIPPGIACKVAYDKNGIILKGIGLEVTDIPQLPIEKIDSLKFSLDSKASNKDLETFKKIVTEMIQPTIDSLGQAVATGIKVNYNKDGRIVSSADLIPSDIPTLPINKIEGLTDIIESFDTYLTSPINTSNNIPDIKVNPGSFIKVTVDQYGRVINGERKLSINDIPNELITKLNTIESILVTKAFQNTVDIVSKKLDDKLDANPSIIPGTYTKVKVDKKGLITYGEKLSIEDLPKLNMSDIIGLEKSLKSKADQKDILTLNSTVSSLVNSLSKIGEITGIKNELQKKAFDSDVKNIANKVNTMQSILDTVVEKLPSDMILEQLSQIQNEVSSLSGEISAIKNYLGIK